MRTATPAIFVFGLLSGACNRVPATDANPRPELEATSGANASRPGTTRAETGRIQKRPRAVTIPVGTELMIVLDTDVGTDRTRDEEAVNAHLVDPISVEGEVVAAEGSTVSGVLTNASSSKAKDRAPSGIRFDVLTP